ncbi:hypothetical protein Cgig2_013743 [Carnegiea gigantea]|uniref:Uncharacterized protein n=1 Tax=Carnegiea gigantea TaxID=171969 RepID=A0A9Q1JWH9_9CARY|nr:hypothetical protein Cgig2_013743 [Carnegiea gigantea]
MARSSIILCLVALSFVAMASATTPAPKKKDPGHIIVQGTILCKQGNKPIAGAKANLTCVGDANGKRSVVTVISNPTDAKGVYVIGVPATLPTGEKLIHCKVSLKSSPLATCKVPTNENNGIKGFGLTKVLEMTKIVLSEGGDDDDDDDDNNNV